MYILLFQTISAIFDVYIFANRRGKTLTFGKDQGVVVAGGGGGWGGGGL